MSEPNMSLSELAERVEKLTGPCRETDAAIGYAIGALKEYREPMDRFGCLIGVEDAAGNKNALFAPWWPCDSKDRRGDLEYIAQATRTLTYTASIDAAMTLADAADDPLDILEEALATAREERDGIYFLPLHICAAALKSLAEKG